VMSAKGLMDTSTWRLMTKGVGQLELFVLSRPERGNPESQEPTPTRFFGLNY